MELVDSVAQLVAVAGYNEDGVQQVLAICTTSAGEVKKTMVAIIDAWDVKMLATFDIKLSLKQTYSREGVVRMEG